MEESPPRKRPAVAVVGASADRTKYGNKSVRAHLRAGYDVYPVNPKETEIEGLKSYASILDVPVALDRVTMYLPPKRGLLVIEDIAQKNPRELFLNPGTESPEIIEKARALGLNPVLACSIVDIGMSPGDL